MKRLLSLLLLCACIVAVLSGCTEIPDAALVDSRLEPEVSLPEPLPLLDRWKQDTGTDGDEIRFSAALFAQQAALSAAFSLEIAVRDGHLYLSGDLYEPAGYESSPDFRMDEVQMWTAKNVDKETAAAILPRLRSSGCYLLKPGDGSKHADRYAVCELDGVYYFLSLYGAENREVLRIHRADMKEIGKG